MQTDHRAAATGVSAPAIFHGAPEMTGQCRLEPSAENRPVQGRDHRLAAGLQSQQHVVQQRLVSRLIHFPDIRSGDEIAPHAVQDDRLDRRILVRFDEGPEQARTNRMCDRVNGGVIDDDERNVFVTLQSYGRIHGT